MLAYSFISLAHLLFCYPVKKEYLNKKFKLENKQYNNTEH